MEGVHAWGAALAGSLQKHLRGTEDLWLWLTYLGDPGTIFLLYFPMAYAVQRRLGVAVLWLGLISEWLNLVFKWFLFGERPFWWVHESGLQGIPELRQFPSTCETGPGSPSGHCMITGAALWPVAMHFTNLSARGVRRWAPLLLYALLMMGIAVSRLLILAHFPHQVLAGILTGVLLGCVLQRSVPHDRGFGFYCLASLFLLLGALLIHEGMSALGVDLSWSIRLATRWCSKAEWIRPETRPFSSVARSAGNALGLGVALHCPLYRTLQPGAPGWRERGVSLLLSALLLKLRLALPAPVSPPLLYYSAYMLQHVLGPLIVLVLAPYLVRGRGTAPKRGPRGGA
ncbi:glucose-6-phosphatase 3 [Gastrophryne carolinensis]